MIKSEERHESRVQWKETFHCEDATSMWCTWKCVLSRRSNSMPDKSWPIYFFLRPSIDLKNCRGNIGLFETGRYYMWCTSVPLAGNKTCFHLHVQRQRDSFRLRHSFECLLCALNMEMLYEREAMFTLSQQKLCFHAIITTRVRERNVNYTTDANRPVT